MSAMLHMPKYPLYCALVRNVCISPPSIWSIQSAVVSITKNRYKRRTVEKIMSTCSYRVSLDDRQ